MKKVALAVICTLLAASFSPTCAAAPEPANSVCHPDALHCEYLIDPIGIDAPHPRLDWILLASGRAPRNLTQTAWQILVASSPQLLGHDKGDLWDSGKVNSSDTTQIPYSGSPLTSREICYWKVRSWDSLGQCTAWSKPASWEIGLLNPEDWQAKWIESVPDPALVGNSIPIALLRTHISLGAAPYVEVWNDPQSWDLGLLTPENWQAQWVESGLLGEYQPVPILRTDVSISASPIVKARLYVTALGLYEMHLNGHRVGDHIFAPDWTDYNKRVRYQAYDVTSLVKPGANTLAGLLGNGWYSGHIGNGGFQAWGVVPALFAQLEVTHADGAVDRTITDANWKTHDSPITSSDFMMGENYDARQEIKNWDRPGLKTTDWPAATEMSEHPATLDSQITQPVRELAELHPKGITQPVPGHYTYDMGQNMVGFVRLHINAPAGTKITLRHAEMLDSNGSIYTTNLRKATAIDTYICKGGGETWQPHFTFHGFRYVELTGLSHPPPLSAVTGIVVGTDIPRTGQFSCSASAVNQLQSNIQWGMRGNYLSVPTDCPQRDERMGWMGDAEVFIRTAAYNGQIAAFFTKWLEDVDDAQTNGGAFMDISPAPYGKGHGNPGIPAWGDAGVICPWTIYLMYGDKQLLLQHLPAMARWVDWCRAHSSNLIRDRDRGRDYGDWLSQNESTSKELIGTAFFAYSTSLVAKAYSAVGDSASADKYQQLFNQIKSAFNNKYVTPDGHIKDGTQTDYCMALQFDLLPDDLRAKAVQYLEDDVHSHQDHLTTGFVGVGHLLPALCSGGKVETAYKVFQQDTFPSWLFSVKQGATTIWERWDGWTPDKGFQTPRMNSFNHYSLGACGEWMFDTVAGIGVDPAKPGFSHIIIQPRPGGTLTAATASFNSIHGLISTNWKLNSGHLSLHVTIPINTSATIIFPPGAAAIQESNLPIAKHQEIMTLPDDGEQDHYLIGSGTYSFTCQLP